MTLNPSYKSLKYEAITADEISRITANSPIREKAFFAIMRQSGLKPHVIAKLKLRDLEPPSVIPRKIDFPRDSQMPPAFIGEEANGYLHRYLGTRENLTPDSLLFALHCNPNREINTKDVSRTFRLLVEKYIRGKKVCLFSLIDFYRKNAKPYIKELLNNQQKDEEVYRNLYKEKALPNLEIEQHLTIEIRQPKGLLKKENVKQRIQIKEMTQTIVKRNEDLCAFYTLLYNNRGDPEIGEDIEIGDYLIDLWKTTKREQEKNLMDCWATEIPLVPYKDIVEELTKTLERIMKPYRKLRKEIDAGKYNTENRFASKTSSET